VPLATRLFVQKELDILGSRNATRFDFESALRQLEKRAIPVEHAISEISSTRNLSRTFESWAAEPDRFTKILVDTAQW
jgi:threonine dehydrogenase-like Zn-dependent dehydrogenase